MEKITYGRVNGIYDSGTEIKLLLHYLDKTVDSEMTSIRVEGSRKEAMAYIGQKVELYQGRIRTQFLVRFPKLGLDITQTL
jgi:hypothetical protein